MSVINPSAIERLQGVYISTYGCQMNVNDSERMYALLEMANYTAVSTPEDASLIIINSCSVREKPVHKVHSEVGTYRRLKQMNPRLKIGVGGCVGQQERQNLLKSLPLLDFVFGPDNIDSLPEIVRDIESRETSKSYAKFEHGKPYSIETLVRNPGVSTFVNITKGCDNFCSFCVVPFTRGRLRSRPLVDILTDVRVLVNRGVREVTLLGQNVNSYESTGGENFAQLLEVLSLETEIQRIRFTTSHPKDFDRDLVKVMQTHRRKICDSIHLPVQSGSTRILHLMNRGYSREEYLEKVEMIREEMPGVSLSTDIIVGFPGETDEDYRQTATLIEQVGYDSIFAFKYSPRPFTKAAEYSDQVPEDVKDRRLDGLLSRHKEQSFALIQNSVGGVEEVLVEKVESRDQRYLLGRTTQNRLVHFEGPSTLIGETVPVKITRATPHNLRGERQL